MSTRTQQGALIASTTFQQQVAGSLVAYAATVLTEGSGVSNHATRLLWANAILVNPMAQASTVLAEMLGNSTIVSDAGNTVGSSGTPCPDADVDSVVSSNFTTWATTYAALTISGVALQLGS